MIAIIIVTISMFIFILYCMSKEQINFMKKYLKTTPTINKKNIENEIKKLESAQRANLDYYVSKFEKCVFYDEKEDILEYQEKVESLYDRQFLKNLDMFIFNKNQKTWLYNSTILPEYVSKVLTLKINFNEAMGEIVKPVDENANEKEE